MSLSVHIEKKLGSFRLAVDLEHPGGITGLLGASGCGKSMTLKAIAGIEKPDRGRIVLDDRVLFDSEKKNQSETSGTKSRISVPELCAVSQYDRGEEYSLRFIQGKG